MLILDFEIPSPVLELIYSFIKSSATRLAFCLTCKNFNQICLVLKKRVIELEERNTDFGFDERSYLYHPHNNVAGLSIFSQVESVTQFQWVLKHYPCNPGLLCDNPNVEILRYAARELDYKFKGLKCKNPNLECVQFLRWEGIEIDSKLVKQYLEIGDINAIGYFGSFMDLNQLLGAKMIEYVVGSQSLKCIDFFFYEIHAFRFKNINCSHTRYAARLGNLEVLKHLKSLGFGFSCPTIGAACYSGSLECVKFCYDALKDQETLHSLCDKQYFYEEAVVGLHDNVEILEFLSSIGIILDEYSIPLNKNKNGTIARHDNNGLLYQALHTGQVRTSRFLITQKVIPPSNILQLAASCRDFDLCKLVYEKYEKYQNEENKRKGKGSERFLIMFAAIDSLSVKNLDYIIKKGFVITVEDFHYACLKGTKEQIMYFVDNGCPMDEDCLVTIAVRNCKMDLIEYLLFHGCPCSEELSRVFARKVCLRGIKFLYEKGLVIAENLEDSILLIDCEAAIDFVDYLRSIDYPVDDEKLFQESLLCSNHKLSAYFERHAALKHIVIEPWKKRKIVVNNLI